MTIAEKTVNHFHRYFSMPSRTWAAHEPPTGGSVWFDGDADFSVSLEHGSVITTTWTSRAGIEALRDACNAALVRSEGNDEK